MLTVYDDKSNLEIDVAIFSALLKKEKNSQNENSATVLKKQIQLALDFNRSDIAQKNIFIDDFDVNMVYHDHIYISY